MNAMMENMKEWRTAAEIADEIDALIPEETREAYIKEYGGLTATEAKDKWAESAAAKERATLDV